MATATRPSLATKYDNTTATAPDVAKRALFRVTARNRCLVAPGMSSGWDDFKDPECLFRAKRPACGGYVQAEFTTMHNAEEGMIYLYAEDADAETDEGYWFINTNPTAREFTVEDLPKMAEFLHALGDACELLHEEAAAKLPELRRQGGEFAKLFTRLVEHAEE